MELEVKFIGKTIVEIHCNHSGATIESDVANLHGEVDQEFIDNLKYIIEELETHNAQIKANLL